jgi:hypothetical protein
MANLERPERLQIMLSSEELAALDDWRFAHRMPTRAAAIRELLKRGMASAVDGPDQRRRRSRDYSVVERRMAEHRPNGNSGGRPNGNSGD